MDTLVSLSYKTRKNENRKPESQQAKGQKLSEKGNPKLGEISKR